MFRFTSSLIIQAEGPENIQFYFIRLSKSFDVPDPLLSSFHNKFSPRHAPGIVFSSIVLSKTSAFISTLLVGSKIALVQTAIRLLRNHTPSVCICCFPYPFPFPPRYSYDRFPLIPATVWDSMKQILSIFHP